MFGFVVADLTQLDWQSAEAYRGAYCGLCSALSRRHGSAMRLTLNYEVTFLALFLSSVYGVKPESEYKRCGIHPIKPRLCLSNEIIDYAADMQRVESTLANVKMITDKLGRTDNTVGLLFNDPTLYNNLSATTANAASLLEDLKAHPKRYVHFSLFGKKDK